MTTLKELQASVRHDGTIDRFAHVSRSLLTHAGALRFPAEGDDLELHRKKLERLVGETIIELAAYCNAASIDMKRCVEDLEEKG